MGGCAEPGTMKSWVDPCCHTQPTARRRWRRSLMIEIEGVHEPRWRRKRFAEGTEDAAAPGRAALDRTDCGVDCGLHVRAEQCCVAWSGALQA